MEKIFNAVKNKVDNFTKNSKNFNYKDICSKYKYLLKAFLVLTFILCLSITSIIRANFNYLDDQDRVSNGTRYFTFFSRYVPQYLSVLIHGGEYLTDTSPFPQILAVTLIAVSGVLLLYLFNKDKEITFLNILSVIPLGLFPYFLECLSYKYDSPYMSLSILVCIIPFLFYGDGKKKKFCFSIINCLCTIIMCTTYQASSGVTILLTMFLALNFWNNKETSKAIHLIWISALSYLLGLIIFETCILVPRDDYVTTGMFPLKELLPGVFSNLKSYYNIILTDFKKLWLVLIDMLTICFVVVNVWRSKQNKILSLILSIIVLILSIIVLILSKILAFGVYPCLEKTLFAPRGMYGTGILIALIGVNATNYGRKINIPKIISFALVWCFIMFTFTYGNLLNEQKRYIDFRVQQVVNAVSELECMKTDRMKEIQIVGDIGKVDTIKHLPENYKNLTNRLIVQSFTGAWVWGDIYFYNYFNLPHIMRAQRDPLPNEIVVVKDTLYYTIETDDVDYIRITLR